MKHKLVIPFIAMFLFLPIAFAESDVHIFYYDWSHLNGSITIGIDKFYFTGGIPNNLTGTCKVSYTVLNSTGDSVYTDYLYYWNGSSWITDFNCSNPPTLTGGTNAFLSNVAYIAYNISNGTSSAQFQIEYNPDYYIIPHEFSITNYNSTHVKIYTNATCKSPNDVVVTAFYKSSPGSTYTQSAIYNTLNPDIIVPKEPLYKITYTNTIYYRTIRHNTTQ